MTEVSLREGHSGAFHFLSVWQVAKQLISLGANAVELQLGQPRWQENCVAKVEWLPEHFSVHPHHCQRRATSCKTHKDKKLAALDEPKLKPLKKVVKPAKPKKHLEHGLDVLEDPHDFSSTSSESSIMDDPIALVEAEPEMTQGPASGGEVLRRSRWALGYVVARLRWDILK